MRLHFFIPLVVLATAAPAFTQPQFETSLQVVEGTFLSQCHIGDTLCVRVPVRPGWNLISNPFDHPLPDNLAIDLFPTLIGSRVIGWFSLGYVWSYTMTKGRAYWGRFPGVDTCTICGTGRTSDSISVAIAWNMIGPIFYPVPVDSVYSIPPGIIGSGFIEFRPVLGPADTLRPGYGYWVKMRGSGLLVLPGGF